MLKNEVFLVFGEDYGRHPHSLEHLVNELLPYNTVLWVETIGMRSPRFTFYDFKRIFQIIVKWIFGKKKTGQIKVIAKRNLTIVSPVMLPFTSSSLVRKMNALSVAMSVGKVIKDKGLFNPILITSLPSTCDFVKIFEEKLSIYYCVDEFCLWPGIPQERIKRMEMELMAKTDLIIATSSSLVKKKTLSGSKTQLLTHGVDLEHFCGKYAEAKRSKGKKICYFGLIDERCDQELIYQIATGIPDCLLTIIGEVTLKDVSRLKKLGNVHFEKKVPYEELPKKIANQDYFILPYLVNEQTNTINPLKIREYLATGKPVISTALPEVVKLKNFLYVGETHEEVVGMLTDLMSGKVVYDFAPTFEYLSKHETWKAKAFNFCQKTQDAILGKELAVKQLL